MFFNERVRGHTMTVEERPRLPLDIFERLVPGLSRPLLGIDGRASGIGDRFPGEESFEELALARREQLIFLRWFRRFLRRLAARHQRHPFSFSRLPFMKALRQQNVCRRMRRRPNRAARTDREPLFSTAQAAGVMAPEIDERENCVGCFKSPQDLFRMRYT